jgi:hypothetical protein
VIPVLFRAARPLKHAVGGIPVVGPVAESALDAVGDLLDPSVSSVDTTRAAEDRDRANRLAEEIAATRRAAGGDIAADRAAQNQTRAQQDQSVADLQAAARGEVPSAAEMQLKQQASTDAARQYAMAAALGGGVSAGGALRQASMGAAQVNGAANTAAAITRATEQANARTALSNAIQQKRQQDQALGVVDTNRETAATTGENAAHNSAVTSTGQEITAQTEKEKAEAQIKAAKYAAAAAGGSAIATALSDKRAKTDVKPKSLADAIGEQVHGVTFEYKPGAEDGGRHFGVLADELERVIPGVVRKGGDGLKRVDTGQLSLANVALISEMADRIKALEGRRGKAA